MDILGPSSGSGGRLLIIQVPETSLRSGKI
jgi:hypothetical protein